MIEWFIYPVVGVIAGISSGLLGLGGGIVVVPSLLTIFILNGVPSSVAMHMAVATSLATIIVTSSASSYSHYRLNTISWVWFWFLVPGLILGGVFGAYLTTAVSSTLLQVCFSIYACFAAFKLWFSMKLKVNSAWHGRVQTLFVGGGIGVISSLLGIGGGTLIVPYLMAAQQPMSKAIGTSAACCVPIAVSAVLSLNMMDVEVHDSGVEAAGLIQWDAFVGIIMTSMLFSMIGASWSKKVPVKLLKRIFSIVLVLTATVLITKT